MSQTVAEFVDGIDGVRGGVADAVGQQFATVAELSEATPDALTALRGVGPVLADRILDAARTAVIADHTPEDEPTPDPATRARASVARAQAATRPPLDVIEGGAEEATDTAADTVETATPSGDTHLPPLVERVATLVGATLGWGIRVYRTVTRPVAHLLRRT